MTMHSIAVFDKIEELCRHLDTDKNDSQLREAVLAMGPSCLFDDAENEEQVKGMLLVLDWFLPYLTR